MLGGASAGPTLALEGAAAVGLQLLGGHHEASLHRATGGLASGDGMLYKFPIIKCFKPLAKVMEDILTSRTSTSSCARKARR